jgi:hypothetical protein
MFPFKGFYSREYEAALALVANFLYAMSTAEEFGNLFLFGGVVLFGAGFDELLNERHREFLVEWEADRCSFGVVPLQLLFVFRDDRCGNVEADVLCCNGEVDEATLVDVVGHSVADALFGLGRCGFDCGAKLPQFWLDDFRVRFDVVVYGFGFHDSGDLSIGGFGLV